MPAQGGQRISFPVPLSSKRKGTTVHATTTSSDSTVRPDARRLRWRVVDIVVASVIGVAVGVVFWAWGVVWGPISAPIEAVLPGLQAAPAAVWLIAGVLGALVIRKPGAAIYTEIVAATVSALIGSQWGGLLTIEAGLVQGLGAELVFAIFLYRNWRLPVALLAGAGAGLAMAINDLVLWYAGAAPAFAIIYTVSAVVGGAVIAGGLSWLAVRGLARAGALDRFAAGRELRTV
ncbi:energy-coupling factor transport system substrate-specific component [Agromyces ramosus]|uniref:Energy-coupling factor transport system substrate-specific component n=1 Tax=Agromyces ramosus TaxID=33879 RepID=A0A4Q7MEX2_9MICO|nr:energy-coupling factor transport system substrate-specific component [Agromyces ramosus]